MSAPLDPSKVTHTVQPDTRCYHCHHPWFSHDQNQDCPPACLVNNCTCNHFQSHAEVRALDELRAEKEQIRTGKPMPDNKHFIERYTSTKHYLTATDLYQDSQITQDATRRRDQIAWAQWHATMATVPAVVRVKALSHLETAGIVDAQDVNKDRGELIERIMAYWNNNPNHFDRPDHAENRLLWESQTTISLRTHVRSHDIPPLAER